MIGAIVAVSIAVTAVERWTFGRNILCIPGSKNPKFDKRVYRLGESPGLFNSCSRSLLLM
jgi:hypothetical protein